MECEVLMKYEIYIVGMGPGREDDMTQEALTVLESCEVIVGYTVYLDLLGERFSGKTFLSTPMLPGSGALQDVL